jgi:hypothetical protein
LAVGMKIADRAGGHRGKNAAFNGPIKSIND